MAFPVDPTIAQWQADEHEIGMIEFAASDTAADNFPYYTLPTNATFLGLMEVDALCLMDDGSLCVYDNEVEGRVICPAAADQAALLAALDVLHEHFEKCVTDEAYCEDQSAAVAVRERCTELAGGQQYESFFCSMIGA